MTVTLEHGPLGGQRRNVPLAAVALIETLDNGVTYSRWDDLIFRYNPEKSDGTAYGMVS